MRFRDIVFLVFLTGCSSYEIPEQEIARLQILVYEKKIKEVNLEKFFKNHQHPKLKDHFFYVLYHLEQQPGNYMVEKQEMTNYFKKHNLNSLIPLDDLEKIVREHSYLKIYTSGFSQGIPGSGGKLSLCASKDLCFYGQERIPGHRNLNLALGSLTMEVNFPYNLVCNLKPEVKALEVYDQGANVIFYCQYLIDGKMKKSRVIYHARDSTSSECDGWHDDVIIEK
ncbi:MAG: hypothetical protein KAT77_00465 [Nanoarchaeota archaeon]|nr:hypothetical protein [Nanoarchaeota archaeon]